MCSDKGRHCCWPTIKMGTGAPMRCRIQWNWRFVGAYCHVPCHKPPQAAQWLHPMSDHRQPYMGWRRSSHRLSRRALGILLCNFALLKNISVCSIGGNDRAKVVLRQRRLANRMLRSRCLSHRARVRLPIARKLFLLEKTPNIARKVRRVHCQAERGHTFIYILQICFIQFISVIF